MTRRLRDSIGAAAVALFVPLAALAAQHEAGAHHHPEAAQVQNPVPSDAQSVERGHKLFDQYCTKCHGTSGKGDGPEAAGLDPRPANLTDAEWKHGDSDGEIFTVIRSGVKGTAMKSFGGRLEAKQIWDLVNYIRSIGPKPSSPAR